jgi:hypothetical protein
MMRLAPLLLLLAAPLRAAGPTVEQAEFFEKKIRPVLAEHCYECHSVSAPKIKAGLRLDSRTATFKAGVIVPGEPAKSKLVEALNYTNIDRQMPPKGKLPAAVIADLTAWVKMGAPWPGDDGGAAVVDKSGFDLKKRKAEHWAWRPVADPEPPAVKDAVWPLVPADRFLLAKLEEKGLSPARPAEANVILRRVYFDLIGLPPTVEEIERFEKEWRAKPQAAFEGVVDRLLASPQFGERWARHWLDLVRYAESRGHEFDPNIPNAWQYRDYVIRALNADVPYDRFVTEHVAGDLLPKPRLNPKEGFNESVLGTGFWFLGEEVHSPVDIRGDEADRFDNRIDVLTKTFLGLTVSCARCHDHKFDAISTKDYYALYGFLRSSNYRLVRFDALDHNKKVAAELAKLREDFRPVILKAYGEALAPGVKQAAEYLLAAREAVGGDADKIAAERKLDPKRLAYWVLHLRDAARDPAAPPHLWAKLADASARPALLDALNKQTVAATLGPAGVETVFDFAAAGPDDWRPDDVSFGPRPVRPGDLRFTDDAARPVARVIDTAAAEFDPSCNGFKPAAGAQLDPGALGYNRTGRTVRTPTFALVNGRVFYLVRGSGRAYAAVDGHVMIAGPLHAALVHPFNTSGKWQWVSHDLRPYAGQRAHLEFTAESPDFAVAKVVRGEAPNATEAPEGWKLHLLEKPDAAAQASALRDELIRVVNRLQRGELDGRDDARIADWLIRHLELFGVGEKALVEVAAPFAKRQAELLASLKTDSRLAIAIQDGSPEDETVFVRGSHKAPGEVVPRRLLEALAGDRPVPAKAGSGRLELARQLTDPVINPFAARVQVNRVWHHLFGRGLVASTDNFGVLGEQPTHPELLDHLATQYIRDGWSLKKLIHTLVLSRAYQMSSQADPTADATDPGNVLLHRARLRRLEGEAIRDALLAISGRLDPALFGPSVPVHLTPFLDGRGRPASGPLDGAGRRSLYTAARRNFLSPFLLAFDTPTPFSTVGRRTVSNVPAQALILLNDPFVHQMTDLWGKQVAVAHGVSRERVTRMYRQAFTRPPTPDELDGCLAYLDERAKTLGAKPDDPRVWAGLAHVLVNVKSFIFLE